MKKENSTRIKGKRDAKSLSEWMKAAHCLAGVILLVFGLSHFGIAIAATDEYTMRLNTVFPFLTEQGVQVVAGVLQTGLGTACLFLHRFRLISPLILTNIAVLLWYRGALQVMGQTNCGCAAGIAQVLGLTDLQEAWLPIFGLIVLGLTTVPWFLTIGGKFRNRRQVGQLTELPGENEKRSSDFPEPRASANVGEPE